MKGVFHWSNYSLLQQSTYLVGFGQGSMCREEKKAIHACLLVVDTILTAIFLLLGA